MALEEETNIFVVEKDTDVILIETQAGQPGVGIPIGGLTDQVLSKLSDSDYDLEWIDNVPPATTIRSDIIDDYLMYRGDALPGSLTSDPVWMIHKLETPAGGGSTKTYANGTSDFIHTWDDRLTYTYS